MPFDVRTIEPAETGAWFESVMTAFLDRSDADAIAAEVVPLWDYRRVWASFEGDTIVGTTRSWATELTVPGGVQLPGTAIAGVTVRPTHRRQGILSRMMTAELDAARDRGETAAMLYASEYPIYGRFGFGPAVPTATWTLNAADGRLPGSAPPGSITFEPLSRATRDEVRRIFHVARARQPGEIWRREFTWDQDLGLRTTSWGPTWKGFVAFHRGSDGTPDGYVRYHVDEKWEQRQPRNVLQVDELHALGDEAYADLWRFLLEMDLVATVRAERRSPAEPLPWLLTNARAAQMSESGDGMWLRLLDVPRALEARSYDRTLSLVLEVVQGGAGSPTRVLLEASPDGATCVPTDRTADLALSLSALSAAYLGGTRLRDAVLMHGANEFRAGALAAADALFRSDIVPWCSTGF